MAVRLTPGLTDVVVLCGGRGTRLGELTASTPKPLLPVAGSPFLLRRLLQLKREGFRRFLLAVHYLAEAFHAFAIQYRTVLPELVIVHEPVPLGTGGALRHAAHHVRSSVLVALNGDTWVDQPLAPVLAEHQRVNCGLTMVVVRPTRVAGGGGHEKGVVSVGPQAQLRGCVRGQSGAAIATWVNAGGYVLARDMVRAWPSGSYDLDQRIMSLLGPEEGRVFFSEGHLVDIGTPGCYASAGRVLAAQAEEQPAGGRVGGLER